MYYKYYQLQDITVRTATLSKLFLAMEAGKHSNNNGNGLKGLNITADDDNNALPTTCFVTYFKAKYSITNVHVFLNTQPEPVRLF